MEKTNRQEIALEYFKKGYNCAQSVAIAFKDILKFDEDTILNAACPFGAGFARRRNICGAVASMGLVIGLLKETKASEEDKAKVYEEVGLLTEEFEKINGSLICKDLLQNVKNLTEGYTPQVRDAEYYKVRPCAKFVLDAVEILEKHITK